VTLVAEAAASEGAIQEPLEGSANNPHSITTGVKPDATLLWSHSPQG
jgi:hypothetical protein